jgi:hypothetical protein
VVAESENIEERKVRSFFENELRLTVHRVPESTKQTPDFQIEGDSPAYLVEVKGRCDDADSRTALADGEIVSGEESLGWAAWTSNVARGARHQLASGDPSHEHLWVLCVVIIRSFATEAVFEQVIGTLYGVRQVAYWGETEGMMCGRECLHVVPGAFERWPEIDGAMVMVGSLVTFCANEFSDRYEILRLSRLWKFFAERGGPITPTDLELNRGFWSVEDRTITRSDERTVEQYLAGKYGVERTYIHNVKCHHAASLIPQRRSRKEQ